MNTTTEKSYIYIFVHVVYPNQLTITTASYIYIYIYMHLPLFVASCVNNDQTAYLRQHDRQCVSVNVFLWGPYKNLVCLSVCSPQRARATRTWVETGLGCVWYSTSSELTVLVAFSIPPRRS